MNGFFWSSGHLGWGIFSLLVFTAAWWLLADLVWRSLNIRIRRFVAVMAAGWIVLVALIVAGFWLAGT